jgi:hypothetical protein
MLGRRPYDWDKRIAKDRKPISYIYTAMYKTESWESFQGTRRLHERTYVARPNDPGLWQQFIADPCASTPCDTPRKYIAHGVDQLVYDQYSQDYQTPVFCLDQLNTIEEGIQKMASIAAGYQELPESIASDFLRVYVLRKAGTAATGSGLWLAGVQDASGNPQSIDMADNMFQVSPPTPQFGNTGNTLLINLNQNGGLTALALSGAITAATTAGLQAAMGQLTMEYLTNCQEDLAANGYHDKEWLMDGKFSITVDAKTRRDLLIANPNLQGMYKGADFAKGGSFYSFGVTNGCGDWLFKEDKEQMRFRFRGDLDGVTISGVGGGTAVWIEQVQPYVNVSATYGIKPQFSTDWKNAPIRMYHAYNREARTIFVPDLTNINPDMKFGMARSFTGAWKWYSPDYFQATDPNTGLVCNFQNDKHNKGYWLGEFRYGLKTVYPECERVILALGQAQPFIRKPNTGTPPVGPTSSTDYQAVLAYAAECYDSGIGGNTTFQYPLED